jgi:DNA-binding response OmpR family regulator
LFDGDTGFVLGKGETIHNILVIAEKREIGPCIAEVLRADGYRVTLEDAFAADERMDTLCDAVIVTNTSLTPPQILDAIPGIKSRRRMTRIIVLSGYSDKEWITDLKRNGMDQFLALPFERKVLLRGVAGLLSGRASAN